MSKKISELTDAGALTGTELVELGREGDNSYKTTVNDLLPVQLQEDKTILLNGKKFSFEDNADNHWDLDSTAKTFFATFTDNNTSVQEAASGSGEAPFWYGSANVDATNATITVGYDGDAGTVKGTLTATDGGSNTYSVIVTPAGLTLVGLNDFANDGAAASGGVPVGGLYHTSGTIKIRLI